MMLAESGTISLRWAFEPVGFLDARFLPLLTVLFVLFVSHLSLLHSAFTSQHEQAAHETAEKKKANEAKVLGLSSSLLPCFRLHHSTV